jgi:hypothetical protein
MRRTLRLVHEIALLGVLAAAVALPFLIQRTVTGDGAWICIALFSVTAVIAAVVLLLYAIIRVAWLLRALIGFCQRRLGQA